MMPVSERLLVKFGEKLGAKRLASSCTTLIFLSLDLLFKLHKATLKVRPWKILDYNNIIFKR